MSVPSPEAIALAAKSVRVLTVDACAEADTQQELAEGLLVGVDLANESGAGLELDPATSDHVGALREVGAVADERRFGLRRRVAGVLSPDLGDGERRADDEGDDWQAGLHDGSFRGAISSVVYALAPRGGWNRDGEWIPIPISTPRCRASLP